MRGKKPMEREIYVLRMGDGTTVVVDREVYLEWRREKYQEERSLRHGECSLDGLADKNFICAAAVDVSDWTEEAALRNICREKLRGALRALAAEDAYMIQLLFFEGVTVRDTARLFGCSRKAVQNRRERILGELCRMLQETGMQGGFF